MDLFEKAKELGELIAESKEMKKLKDYEAAVEADRKAKVLLGEYKLLQIELAKAKKENRDTSIIDGISKLLLEKEKQVNEYETTCKFIEAKNEFDKLIRNVNNVIKFAITGEIECTPDKCGSCGKGCK